MNQTEIVSIDARTGARGRSIAVETPVDEVAGLVHAAAGAVDWLATIGRAGRAQLLGDLADALERHRGEIVATADRETALGAGRLSGELDRTCFQLRFLGEVASEGGYLDVTIDHAADTPAGHRPDLRKTAVPLGPVAIFGASNFPLAFSVPGGDTASALASGCPVVVKAHPSHVATCALVGEIFARVLKDGGAPKGVFALVHGTEAGVQLVRDPRIAAVGFTGSLAGGRALFDIAQQRAEPIPFFGELGSVNPFVVTESAANERAEEIGAGFAASMSLGAGQFCTKPGLLLVPATPAGDSLVSEVLRALEAVEPVPLLNDGIREAFDRGVDSARAVATQLTSGARAGRLVSPVLSEVTIDTLIAQSQDGLLDERFGPFALVVRYGEPGDVVTALTSLPPALTGTVHTGIDDPDATAVIRELASRSGRVVCNGYPTGVAVSWAMHHGGPFPASTVPSATSVGAAAIGRWVRPVTYQDVPDPLLPDELTDAPRRPLVRRVDGRLEVPLDAGVDHDGNRDV